MRSLGFRWLQSSICTDEKVAGFKDIQTGKFTEIMLIRDSKDMDAFLEKYDISVAENRVVIISLVYGDNVVADGMADRREAMPTQRPGVKRRAEGEGEKFYCEALAEQWDFFSSLSEWSRSHNVRKFQTKMQGRCLRESFELHFSLEFPSLAGKFKGS